MATADRQATIRDVAALCGVATSTVSRALSAPSLVSDRTRKVIQEAAAQLNYVPNSRAKALKSGQTDAVGVLVPDMANPFYFDLLRGAQLQLKAADRRHVLIDTEESGEAEAHAIQQLGTMVDGIIIVASQLSDDALTAASASLPIVTVDRDVPGVPSIVIDTPSAAVPVLDHLVSLGHTEIAYVSGPASSQSNTRRWANLATAALSRGVQLRKLGPFAPKSQSGTAAADTALNSGATACIVFNDLIAIGMLQRLQHRGVKIPGDMSIVGCDDIFGADFCDPPLTTVTSPIEQTGRMAVALLLAQQSPISIIANPSPWVMPTYLTVRSSTGFSPDLTRPPASTTTVSRRDGESGGP